MLSALGIILKEFLIDKFNLIETDLKNNLKNIKEDFIKLINNFEVDNDLSNEEIKNITNQVYKFINEYKTNFCNISGLFKFLKEDAINFILIIQKLFDQNLDKEKYNDFILKSIPIKTFFISYISEEKKVYLMEKLKKNITLNFQSFPSNFLSFPLNFPSEILNNSFPAISVFVLAAGVLSLNFFVKHLKGEKYNVDDFTVVSDLEHTLKDNNLKNLFNNNDKIIKNIIEENSGILSEFSEEILNKCDFNNFYKITIKLINYCKSIYNSWFNFIPQIEIKFNDVSEINKELIDNLTIKLKEILNNKNFNIIGMKKGSLSIIIGLNYLIQERINNINKNDVNAEEFLKILNETLEIETKNIKSIIKDNLTLVAQNKNINPDFIYENILDLSTEESKNIFAKIIKNQKKEDIKDNIFELSQNISIDDIKDSLQKLFRDEKELQDNLYNIIINPEIQENLNNFDYQYEDALKNSIFEYNTKSVSYIFRDNEEYKSEQLHCENIEKKILFHGTSSFCISRILPTNFNQSNPNSSWYGPGIYFSDNLDYIWRYSSDSAKGSKANFINNASIKIGDSFSFIASEVFYNKLKFEQIYNKEETAVPKYGIRHVIVNSEGEPIKKEGLEKYKKFKGTEYLITEKGQISPLLAITVQRVEFLIIWRDNNFDSSNPNKYSYFNEMFEYNQKIKKYVSKNLETKIYYFKESNEALEFIKRKKYNKIILITNGANNGEEFLDNARKIIGNNTIALITCYLASNHLKWIKNKENVLLNSKEKDCIKEFIKLSVEKNKAGLKTLQKQIENAYKFIDESFVFKEINENAFEFPNFKEVGKQGKLQDLDFSETEIHTNSISQNNSSTKTVCSFI